jgi:hypothetical protein
MMGWSSFLVVVGTFLGALAMLQRVSGQNSGYIPFVNETLRHVNLGQTDHKDQTNFCARQLGVFNGSVAFAEALSGLTINLGLRVPNQTDPAWVSYSPEGLPEGGFFYKTWMAIAANSGFNIQWVMPPYQPYQQGDTAKLQQILPHMDFYIGTWHSDTTTRRLLGMGFIPIVDASLVLVGVQNPPAESASFWNFAAPFSNQLWGCLFALLLTNGVFMWFFIRAEVAEEIFFDRVKGIAVSGKTGEERSWIKAHEFQHFLDIMYRSILSFAVNGRLKANSYKSMILNLVFSFVLLILAASYIANLATNLITAGLPSTTLASIDDANAKGATLCIQKGASSVSVIQTYYPNIKLAQYPSPFHITNVALGLCDGGVVAKFDFQTGLERKAENPNCNLVQSKLIGLSRLQML